MRTTALLVIDVQNHLIANPENPAYRAHDVLVHIAGLLERARTAQVPVFYLQHSGEAGSNMAPGAPGWSIHTQVEPVRGEPVIQKTASDSFYQTTLQEHLEANGVKHLVITGLRTEMCVDTTCRVAISRGYDVTLVMDAHTTCDSAVLSAEHIVAHHNYTLDDFGTEEHVVVARYADDVCF